VRVNVAVEVARAGKLGQQGVAARRVRLPQRGQDAGAACEAAHHAALLLQRHVIAVLGLPQCSSQLS
jgi:hypothetical protein